MGKQKGSVGGGGGSVFKSRAGCSPHLTLPLDIEQTLLIRYTLKLLSLNKNEL